MNGSNVPRTNAIPIPGSRISGSQRRYSLSYAGRETEAIGQELRNIGDDLDRLLLTPPPSSPSFSSYTIHRFLGRSRSLSMVSPHFYLILNTHTLSIIKYSTEMLYAILLYVRLSVRPSLFTITQE